MKKVRLDQLVFDRGLTESRERAKTTVMSGLVFVNGERADKPGAQVSSEAVVEIRGEPLKYASRGGLKLEKALDEFGVNPAGKICLDCGASTGGFTDCLLQRGAPRVYAVDVGYGQLAWRLRSDERVISMERTNIRHVSPESLVPPPELCCLDLSFISLKLVLPVVKSLMTGGGEIICLIKPQFEAGRDKVGKKGVVRDPEVHLEVLEDFLRSASDFGFTPVNLSFSPVRGPEGNIEFLAHLKTEIENAPEPDQRAVVSAAHDSFKEDEAL